MKVNNGVKVCLSLQFLKYLFIVWLDLIANKYLLQIVMDVPPNQTIYINNLNEKVKKEGK